MFFFLQIVTTKGSCDFNILTQGILLFECHEINEYIAIDWLFFEILKKH